MSYFNLVGQIRLHLPELEDLVRLDVAEIRRKEAEERAKNVESDSDCGSKSGSKDSAKQGKAKSPSK